MTKNRKTMLAAFAALSAMASQSFAAVVLPDFGIVWSEYTTELADAVGAPVAASLTIGIGLLALGIAVKLVKRFAR